MDDLGEKQFNELFERLTIDTASFVDQVDEVSQLKAIEQGYLPEVENRTVLVLKRHNNAVLLAKSMYNIKLRQIDRGKWIENAIVSTENPHNNEDPLC